MLGKEVLRFDRVSFGYGGKPILRDLSFTLEDGKRLAIVGTRGG